MDEVQAIYIKLPIASNSSKALWVERAEDLIQTVRSPSVIGKHVGGMPQNPEAPPCAQLARSCSINMPALMNLMF